MANHTISGGGGVKLHVSEHGDPKGNPILFIHGWSQSQDCWIRQYEDSALSEFRLLGLDLRGHGMSERPETEEDYTSGNSWADDVAAVMEQLQLERPVLVGWSYGGFVISDYLNKYGCEELAGVNLVNAAVVLRPDAFGKLIGPGFFEHVPSATSPNLAENIAAMRAFLRGCTAKPLSSEDFETFLAFNMVVPPWVRGFLVARELDFGPTLKATKIPIKVTHGRADKVVLPAMAEYILDNAPKAHDSWYEEVGHTPFVEEHARFNEELAEFARTLV